ncbi:uncharacterized protein LOC128205932 isoform X2 [Mya arenaria]|nr:uncharacterized protein LOC128205932 isoform X2 [Mya arenaria]
MLERQLCPVCCRSGTRSFLKSYQINLDEAVVLCENKKCTYPLGQDGTSQFTYSRKMSDLPSGRETDFGLSVPPSQSELQARAHSRMRKLGLLQNDAKAIQTGSPQLLRKHRQSTAVSTARASSRDATLHLPHSYAPYSTPSSSQYTTTEASNANTAYTCLSNGHCYNSGYQSNTAKASYKNRELRKRRGSAGSSDRESLNSSNDNLDSGSDKSAASCPNRPTDTDPLQSMLSSYQICNEESTPNEFEQLCSVVDNFPVRNTQLPTAKDAKLEKYSSIGFDFTEDLIGANSGDMTLPPTSSNSITKYPKVFPQWRNQDNLCWLDVILCLSVHNASLRRTVKSSTVIEDCLISKLFAAHDQAMKLVEKINTKTASEFNSTEEGTGSVSSKGSRKKRSTSRQKSSSSNGEELKTDERPLSPNSYEIEKVLNVVREEVWQMLSMKLRCKRGQHESPVFAFPLFLKQTPAVAELFKMKYSFEYKCTVCDYTESHSFENLLPTFPELVEDFQISSPAHKKCCPECGNNADHRRMQFTQLPDSILMHFTAGLSKMPLSSLQFSHHGNMYTVTGVIQYLTGREEPNHFVTWLRNPYSDQWMKCDDLDHTLCQYTSSTPTVENSQVHIVMWEKVTKKPPICRQLALDSCSMFESRLEHNNEGRLHVQDAGESQFKAVSEGILENAADQSLAENTAVESHLNLGDSENFDMFEDWEGTFGACVNKSDSISQLAENEDCRESFIKCTSSQRNSKLRGKTPKLEPFSFGNASNGAKDVSINNCDKSSNSGNAQCSSSLSTDSSVQVVPNIILPKLSPPTAERVENAIKMARKASVTRSGNVSPSSSASSEQSLHLPDFVTSVLMNGSPKRPIAFALRRPIPCAPSQIQVDDKDSVLSSDGLSKIRPKISMASSVDNENTVPGSKQGDTVELKEPIGVKCRRLSGPVLEIQPSTVFCRPTKVATSETKMKSTSDDNLADNLFDLSKFDHDTAVSCNMENTDKNVLGNERIESNEHIESMSDNKPFIAVPLNKVKFIPDQGISCIPTVNSTNKNETDDIDKSSVVDKDVVRNADVKSGNGRESSISKRFKLPAYMLNKKAQTSASLSRNAFSALPMTKVSPNTVAVLKEDSSPGSMSEVKHYLLNKATGNAHNRFHGLNLKSQKLRTSASTPLLTHLVTNIKGANVGMFDSSLESGLNMKFGRKITNSAGSYSGFQFKRKSSDTDSDSLDKNSNKKVKINEESDQETADAHSLKENKTSSKKLPPRGRVGGKNMKLIEKWAKQSKETLSSIEPISTKNFVVEKLKASPLKSEAKVDNDHVLQDLYEALNIPFSAVNDTMATIMTDVDDILNFVSTDEILPEVARPNSSQSCVSIPIGSRAGKSE